MFKLVVLFALVAVTVAKPSGHLHGGVVSAYAVPAAVVAVPAAVSHTYRHDVVSKPVVAAYAAHAVVPAPVVHHVAPVAIPAAVSHSYRSDVISQPIVAAHAVPVVSYAAHHAPAVHAW